MRITTAILLHEFGRARRTERDVTPTIPGKLSPQSIPSKLFFSIFLVHVIFSRREAKRELGVGMSKFASSHDD